MACFANFQVFGKLIFVSKNYAEAFERFDFGLSTSNTSSVFRSMYSNKALAVGANSSISLSSDNGLNWTSRTLSGFNNANFNAAILQDANKGFIIGDTGLVLTSIDGGLNWNKIDNANKENLVSMSKKPNNGIYAVGKKGVIMKIQ